jgi:hypothetical protein
MSLEGKTIARVIDLDYNGQALVFTDGTAAHIQGSGYEDSCASLDELTEMDALRLEADVEDRRREDAISREHAIARREMKERIKRNVSAQAWANWRKVHVSSMEAMNDLMMETWSDGIERQLYGGVTVGSLAAVPQTSARRT